MKQKSNEEIIEFEGKRVTKNKSGYYKCPFKCGNPEYPAAKWKTAKGFKNHMVACQKKPSRLKEIEDKKRIAANMEVEKQAAVIKCFKSIDLPYKPFDKIHFVRSRVVKPTHEWRGTRNVRVRYEEVRKYYSQEMKIGEVIVNFPSYLKFNGKEEEILPFVLFCEEIHKDVMCRIKDIFKTEALAREEAKKRQKAHDVALEEASLCR